MAGQLMPPPGYEPKVPADATPQQCIRMWVDLMNACEQFLLARLREEIGPNGDLKAAYRKWYRQQMDEHDQTMLHMMQEFERRGGGHAR